MDPTAKSFSIGRCLSSFQPGLRRHLSDSSLRVSVSTGGVDNGWNGHCNLARYSDRIAGVSPCVLSSSSSFAGGDRAVNCRLEPLRLTRPVKFPPTIEYGYYHTPTWY
ncbi:hypothetical protein BT93_B2299 [Corymbia citriodora subsp. variegata]|nr:hypothetical protein BT93_B2299 [Corymbia citriodora subsp. variegata]